MRNFLTGILVGSLMSAVVAGAGSQLYDSHGKVQAPAGSQQSFDYFRLRQFYLDQGAIRAQGEQAHRDGLSHPCGK
jgi:hypothetical protein